MAVTRKTVTVLFCDVTGSTALGESIDPEALQSLLVRYFERMKQIVELHGGTVEKFIGDAVMAVFGVPIAHEDDALRALRAAVAMRDALPELGVRARIGVNTGEVVTGAEERLATGDTVNVAARLEQAAEPGEVLIGEETRRAAGEAADAEPVEPLQLKGKREPVEAYRLLAAREASARRHGSLFVGREHELALVHEAWARAQADRSCELVTVVGDAGVGKTRLAAEALARLEAKVVRGRCLSYGEGITYWPVVEVIKQLDALPANPAAAEPIRALLGDTDAGTSAEEIAWGFRKLLEEAAPVVVVFEDIHWGEETFLDLIESVALLSVDAPILLLCLARPDLSERRHSWAVTARLPPLSTADVEQLIPGSLTDELREKILHAGGGNPLFVTEMVAMAGDAGSEVTVPPTLKALLAARLDQLDTAERRVLERGAVEGEIFHRGAVQSLAPEELQVTARLASLVRREVVRPERTQIPGDDGFRFRHLLIRDSAYEALSKATRADLHERFASWFEAHGAELVEFDEILGHHLEQACRYKADLGLPDAELANRACDRLAAAGRRALWRGDVRAAARLLERGLELTRSTRLDVALDLAEALRTVDPRRGAQVAAAAAERAREAGDRTGEALARTAAAFHTSVYADNPDIVELGELARAALPLLEQANDHAGLVHIWLALSYGVANWHGDMERWAMGSERALRHARLAGHRPTHLFGLEQALAAGPQPADQALRTLDALLPEYPHPQSLLVRALLLAMLGRLDEAQPIARQESERLRELTGDDSVWALGQIARLAGDDEVAVEVQERVCDRLEREGQRNHLSGHGPLLGRTLCALGRYSEAEHWAQIGRELAAEADVWAQGIWRHVQALVEGHRGNHQDALALAGQAVTILDRTDGLNWQGDAYCDLAEVLALAGRSDEAAAALEQALDRYERKRNVVMAARTRARLAAPVP